MQNLKLTSDDIKKLGLENLVGMIPEDRLTACISGCSLSGFNKIVINEEMMNTCLAFLHNNLNISATASALYMHRNTLMYRLNKVTELTGLDLRRFDMAVTFSVLAAYIKYIKNKKV